MFTDFSLPVFWYWCVNIGLQVKDGKPLFVWTAHLCFYREKNKQTNKNVLVMLR